jgi:hypothetical protein
VGQQLEAGRPRERRPQRGQFDSLIIRPLADWTGRAFIG